MPVKTDKPAPQGFPFGVAPIFSTIELDTLTLSPTKMITMTTAKRFRAPVFCEIGSPSPQDLSPVRYSH